MMQIAGAGVGGEGGGRGGGGGGQGGHVLLLHYDALLMKIDMWPTPNWLNFIFWLSLLLEISDNMCFVITCFPVDDVIVFLSNLFPEW